MIWTLAPTPGSRTLTCSCESREEYDAVVAQGEHLFDGQRARVSAAGCEPSLLFVRFELVEPFRMPPVRLHFEDTDVAEKIAAFGVYTFEGALYTAELEAPGTLLLDRLFPTEPPPVYHGRAWLAEPEAQAVAA